MLQHMAKRMGATITNVAASHALSATEPGAVAEAIVDAAQNAARTYQQRQHTPGRSAEKQMARRGHRG